MATKESHKILIVGHYPQISEIVKEYKSLTGHKPIIVSNCEEALLVASKQSHIDLLLTDIMMSETDSINFTEQFKILCPESNVLYMIL